MNAHTLSYWASGTITDHRTCVTRDSNPPCATCPAPLNSFSKKKPSRNFKTDLLSCLSSSFSQTHAFKQHFGKTSKTHMPADPFHSNYTGSVQLHNTEQFRHLAKRPARLRLNYLLLSPRALLLSCGPLGLIPYSSTFRNL